MSSAESVVRKGRDLTAETVETPTGIGLLEEGRTCWRVGTARRAAVLRDGQSYFTALYDSLLKAKKYVLVAGWEIDTRVKLRWTDNRRHGRLSKLLRRMLDNNPDLEIFILVWDYSVFYVMERDPLSSLRLGIPPHRRLHYHMDNEHPLVGSHHQKIVIVDGEVAYAGGLDLTKRRWDTHNHHPNDPHRIDPSGVTYPPFHDVQMVVDGEIARHLAELFAERWLRATGNRLRLRDGPPGDPWPESAPPQFSSVRVGISRTAPEYKRYPGIKEIRTLFLESIARAREYIYLEHQFFTSPVIRDALIERLQDPVGPQIIIVLSKRSLGWLEEYTLDHVRDVNLLQLFAGDKYGRLGIFYPFVEGLDGSCIKVHSKVSIIDDRILRVGSANLTNRSMGMDTECDLTIEAGTAPEVRRQIARVRDTLIGEHMGLPPEKVADREPGMSLLAFIEKQGGSPRRLKSFRPEMEQRRQEILLNQEIYDPEEPLAIDRLMDDLVPSGKERIHRGRLLKIGIALALMIGLALLWKVTPLSEYVQVETFTRWSEMVRENIALTPFLVLLTYIVASLVMFPVTILIAATAAMFDFVSSVIYAYLGCISSAAVTYFIGARLGRDKVQELTGTWLNRLANRFRKQGLLTVTVIRMLPLAPFTMVNVVAGALHIRFRHYILGTFLGMTPGILAITLFTERLVAFVRDPQPGSLLVLIALAAALIVAGTWIKRRLTSVPE
jgi:phospholipase D1/2